MIKKQAYIRGFSPEQKAQLEKISAEKGLKTATDVFLHCLDEYYSMKNQNARLERFLARKNEKIEMLQAEIQKLRIEIETLNQTYVSKQSEL